MITAQQTLYTKMFVPRQTPRQLPRGKSQRGLINGWKPLWGMQPNFESQIHKGNIMKLSEFRGWAIEYGETNFSRKTAEWYKNSFDALIKHIGDKNVEKMKPIDLETFKTKRKKEVTDSTVNINMRAIKSCFRKAFDLELIRRNPAEKVKAIHEVEQSPLYLTEEDAKGFLRATQTEPWFGKIVLFAMQTGLRRGEITNLRKTDFDRVNRVLHVHSTANYRVKFGKVRTMLRSMTWRYRLSWSV